MKIPLVNSLHRKKIRRFREILLKYHQLDKRMVCLMVSVLKIKSYLRARALKKGNLNQIKSLKKSLKIITVKLFIPPHLLI